MEKIVKQAKSKIKQKIGGKKNTRLLVHTISELYKSTDFLVKAREKSKEVKFDCKNGCNYCCHIRVEVLPPEAFKIADFLNSLDEKKKQEYIDKLESHAQYAKDKKYADFNRPCPFLENSGSCGIYAIRPQRCRAYLSQDVSSCEKRAIAIEDEELKIATSQVVVDAVDIYKLRKCVMHPSELGSSVLAALNDDNLKERWANGEQVFEFLPEKITF